MASAPSTWPLMPLTSGSRVLKALQILLATGFENQNKPICGTPAVRYRGMGGSGLCYDKTNSPNQPNQKAPKHTDGTNTKGMTMTHISTLIVMHAHKIVESVYLVLAGEISQDNGLVELLPEKGNYFQIRTTCTFTGIFC